MKKCFKCGIEKNLSEFYVHPRMGDGHLNKCKECTKNDVHKDYKKNILNPEWHQKEKDRGCEKYHRLNYCNLQKPTYENKKRIMDKHMNKYPEKYLAKLKSASIHAPEGFEKHHWSYNKEHYKDVFYLSNKDHNTIHRFMIYDQERMMYRDTDGVLLDTREMNEKYMKNLIIKYF